MFGYKHKAKQTQEMPIYALRKDQEEKASTRLNRQTVTIRGHLHFPIDSEAFVISHESPDYERQHEFPDATYLSSAERRMENRT